MKFHKEDRSTWCHLGEFIERIDERNVEDQVHIVKSVSVSKEFKDTNAKVDKTKLQNYKIVKPGEISFVQTTGNEKCLCIAVNHFCEPLVVTSVNEVFKVDETRLLADYLYIWWRRSESDRYARYNSWGSARETFDWKDMCRTEIPVPPLEVQQEVVETWQGLRKMKQENEALVEPLLALCRSYLQECKKKYPMKEIGPYLLPHDERNSNLEIKLSQGVANTKEFQDPKQVSSNSCADKIVHRGQFAYNRATTRNGEKISIAYREGPDCTVSSAYQVFSVADENTLSPLFLLLWVSRPEFDRYARYMSKGSAHEFFEFDEMCRVKMPLPPIEVQQAIVDVYRCANEAKRIAAEADRLSREICPALVRYAAAG